MGDTPPELPGDSPGDREELESGERRPPSLATPSCSELVAPPVATAAADAGAWCTRGPVAELVRDSGCFSALRSTLGVGRSVARREIALAARRI